MRPQIPRQHSGTALQLHQQSPAPERYARLCHLHLSERGGPCSCQYVNCNWTPILYLVYFFSAYLLASNHGGTFQTGSIQFVQVGLTIIVKPEYGLQSCPHPERHSQIPKFPNSQIVSSSQHYIRFQFFSFFNIPAHAENYSKCNACKP